MASVWVYGVHKRTMLRLQRLVAAPCPGAPGCPWQRRNAAGGQMRCYTCSMCSREHRRVPRRRSREVEAAG
jgi:hypothetical protein